MSPKLRVELQMTQHQIAQLDQQLRRSKCNSRSEYFIALMLRDAAGMRPNTAAEQKALAELHLWLHSPGGDYDLIEACAEFHEEIGTDDAKACGFAERTIAARDVESRAVIRTLKARSKPDPELIDTSALVFDTTAPVTISGFTRSGPQLHRLVPVPPKPEDK